MTTFRALAGRTSCVISADKIPKVAIKYATIQFAQGSIPSLGRKAAAVSGATSLAAARAICEIVVIPKIAADAASWPNQREPCFQIKSEEASKLLMVKAANLS